MYTGHIYNFSKKIFMEKYSYTRGGDKKIDTKNFYGLARTKLLTAHA